MFLSVCFESPPPIRISILKVLWNSTLVCGHSLLSRTSGENGIFFTNGRRHCTVRHDKLLNNLQLSIWKEGCLTSLFNLPTPWAIFCALVMSSFKSRSEPRNNFMWRLFERLAPKKCLFTFHSNEMCVASNYHGQVRRYQLSLSVRRTWCRWYFCDPVDSSLWLLSVRYSPVWKFVQR